MEVSYEKHYSVFNKEVLDFFTDLKNESNFFLDMTFGAGGHTTSILQKIKGSIVVAFDQDPDAFVAGKNLLKEKGLESKSLLINSNFSNLDENIDKIKAKFSNFKKFAGIVYDLGVSSHHFDKAERGFSFRFDGPLDMRMNPKDDIPSAKTVVNNASLEELQTIFSEYGQERFSKIIAQNIVQEREKKVIETTKDLEDIIFHSYPKKLRFKKINPSTKCFQALRIYVNRELDVLTDSIPRAYEHLSIGGLMAIISFHSLEDRIAKHTFKNLRDSFNAKIITKKPIVPTEEEIKINFRSRSAKLRVLEKGFEVAHGKKKY